MKSFGKWIWSRLQREIHKAPYEISSNVLKPMIMISETIRWDFYKYYANTWSRIGSLSFQRTTSEIGSDERPLHAANSAVTIHIHTVVSVQYISSLPLQERVSDNQSPK